MELMRSATSGSWIAASESRYTRGERRGRQRGCNGARASELDAVRGVCDVDAAGVWRAELARERGETTMLSVGADTGTLGAMSATEVRLVRVKGVMNHKRGVSLF